MNESSLAQTIRDLEEKEDSLREQIYALEEIIQDADHRSYEIMEIASEQVQEIEQENQTRAIQLHTLQIAHESIGETLVNLRNISNII